MTDAQGKRQFTSMVPGASQLSLLGPHREIQNIQKPFKNWYAFYIHDLWYAFEYFACLHKVMDL